MKKSCRARRRTSRKTSRRTRCKTSRRTRCKTSRRTRCKTSRRTRCKTSRRTRCKTGRRTRCKTSRRTRCKTSRRTRCKTRCETSRRGKIIKKLGKSRKFKKRKVFFGGIVLTKEFNNLPEFITLDKYRELKTKDEKDLYLDTPYFKKNDSEEYISRIKYLNSKEKENYDQENIFYKKKKTNEPYDKRTQQVRRAFIEREKGAVEMNFENTELSEYQQQYNEKNETNIKYRKPLIDLFKTNFDAAYLDAVDQLKDQTGFPPPDKHFDSLDYSDVIYWEKIIMTEIFGTNKGNWNLNYLPKSIVGEKENVYFTPKLLDHIMNKTPLEVAEFAPGFAPGSAEA